nr:hypothetical protein [Pseudomonas sp.]
MMAAFSVVATLASVFAVVLLKDTLAATREAVRAADDAVKVTRVLGQAQVRAYLNCVGGDYTFGDDFISIQVHLTNSGQSPAPSCRVTGRITALAPKGVPGTALGMKVLPLNLFPAEFTGIPSGGTLVKSHLTAFDNQRVNETFKALGRGSWYFYVQCKMSWIDVFGDEQTLSFFLSQIGKDEFGETSSGFRRSGGLEARNTKPNPDESNN